MLARRLRDARLALRHHLQPAASTSPKCGSSRNHPKEKTSLPDVLPTTTPTEIATRLEHASRIHWWSTWTPPVLLTHPTGDSFPAELCAFFLQRNFLVFHLMPANGCGFASYENNLSW